MGDGRIHLNCDEKEGGCEKTVYAATKVTWLRGGTFQSCQSENQARKNPEGWPHCDPEMSTRLASMSGATCAMRERIDLHDCGALKKPLMCTAYPESDGRHKYHLWMSL